MHKHADSIGGVNQLFTSQLFLNTVALQNNNSPPKFICDL